MGSLQRLKIITRRRIYIEKIKKNFIRIADVDACLLHPAGNRIRSR